MTNRELKAKALSHSKEGQVRWKAAESAAREELIAKARLLGVLLSVGHGGHHTNVLMVANLHGALEALLTFPEEVEARDVLIAKARLSGEVYTFPFGRLWVRAPAGWVFICNMQNAIEIGIDAYSYTRLLELFDDGVVEAPGYLPHEVIPPTETGRA